MTKLQKIIWGILALVDIVLLIILKPYIVNHLPMLAQESIDAYDDIIVGIISTVFWGALQFMNNFAIKFLANSKFIYNLLSKIFGLSKDNIRKYIQMMLKFAFSVKTKWGPNLHSSNKKIANIAEGLLACVDALKVGIDLPDNYILEAKSIANDLLNELTIDGYKSYNENVYTVHCTSMALYALKRCSEVNLISVNQKKRRLIEQCLKQMLQNANECGWGFENKKYDEIQYDRAFSTIWALRALNMWGFSKEASFSRILKNLIGYTNGVIGFGTQSVSKTTPTAMLICLLDEIGDNDIKDKILEVIDTKAVITYLCKHIKETEVEQYNINLDTNKYLPWNHLSECYVLMTLLHHRDQMNKIQLFKVMWNMKKICKKIDPKQYYYIVESLGFNHSDPFFYPTTYLISLFCCFVSQDNS